jgi:hypothetical protein
VLHSEEGSVAWRSRLSILVTMATPYLHSFVGVRGCCRVGDRRLVRAPVGVLSVVLLRLVRSHVWPRSMHCTLFGPYASVVTWRLSTNERLINRAHTCTHARTPGRSLPSSGGRYSSHGPMILG